jgi:hypothetical protein
MPSAGVGALPIAQAAGLFVDPEEDTTAVRARRAPMMSASAGLPL